MEKIIDRTLLSFVIIGVINTIVGMAIMFGLYNLAGISYWLSTAANYIIVSFLSFFLNKKYTFCFNGRIASSGMRFAINIGACYFLAYSIAKPGVILALAGQDRTVQENVAMLVGMCIFTVLNYLGQKLFVFADSASEEPRKTREELEEELRMIMALPDDENAGSYYDREADTLRQKKAIEAACRCSMGNKAAEAILHPTWKGTQGKKSGEDDGTEA